MRSSCLLQWFHLTKLTYRVGLSHLGGVGSQVVELLLKRFFLEELGIQSSLHVGISSFRKEDDRGHKIVISDVETHGDFDRGNGKSETTSEGSADLDSLKTDYRDMVQRRVSKEVSTEKKRFKSGASKIELCIQAQNMDLGFDIRMAIKEVQREAR